MNNLSAQEVTKVCYTEKTRNLSFKIKTENLKDLKACVKIIKRYNEFDYILINEALSNFADFSAHYGEDNPNNGSDLLEYEIGREGSPVMYITYRNTYKNKYRDTDGELKELTDDEFKSKMKQFAKATMADECDFEDETLIMGITCRLWWD